MIATARRVLIGAALIASTFFSGAMLTGTASSSDPFAHACTREGQNGCYWLASTMGNGLGHSYVVTSSGQVFYFSPEMSAYPKSPFHK